MRGEEDAGELEGGFGGVVRVVVVEEELGDLVGVRGGVEGWEVELVGGGGGGEGAGFREREVGYGSDGGRAREGEDSRHGRRH